MYFSKIWLFLVTLAGAIALTIALVMPRPAQRARAQSEQQRLVLACSVVDILLRDNAISRVDNFAAPFGRDPELVNALTQASDAPAIDEPRARAAAQLAASVRDKIKKSASKEQADIVTPDFVILLDRSGRVVARVGGDREGAFGDSLAGRAIVDDALAGYLRDDLWAGKNALFLVAAAPVIKRDPPVAYEGAVVLGHAVSQTLAAHLVKSLDVDIGFYLRDQKTASLVTKSGDANLPPDKLATAIPTAPDIAGDCNAKGILDLSSGDKDYSALLARLPGEARHQDAFYAVYTAKPSALGFAGTLGAVKNNDLGFGNFPWLLVGALLVIALGIGFFLHIWETDRPLARLSADAVKLAKGESPRLAEEEHHGKFGSIARSVNTQIDKLHRDAKSARKDLDQLLGPAPEGSLGAMDLVAATALPAARPGLPLGGVPTPASPPPPSEFRFGDSGGTPAPRAAAAAPSLDLGPPPAARPAAPGLGSPPARPTPPPRSLKPPIPSAPPLPSMPSMPGAGPGKRAVEDDILGAIEDPLDPAAHAGGAEPNTPQEEAYFHTVYDQFVDMKKKCGESIAGLTFAKFSDKLRKNRDELMSKTVCRSVKFTVYVKDGKAALKATPVKD
jgi:hypothetical protein